MCTFIAHVHESSVSYPDQLLSGTTTGADDFLGVVPVIVRPTQFVEFIQHELHALDEARVLQTAFHPRVDLALDVQTRLTQTLLNSLKRHQRQAHPVTDVVDVTGAIWLEVVAI